MEIYILEDYDKMSKKAADVIKEQVIQKPNSILGLATGSTPEGMYKYLVEYYENNELDFKDVTTFNLDEYLGLDDLHEQSYHYFMDKHLLSKINVKKENIHIPDGLGIDIDNTCTKYDKAIESAGGIDLQILGIGLNGHIGFNEPGTFIAETHQVDLTNDTIMANSRFFENQEDVPKMAITMGMKSIMGAKKIILMASGSSKARAIKMSLEGPITPDVPASILQLHQNLIVIIDEEAGALLENK